MAETRRRFDPEFLAGAVRIVRETKKPIAQVVRDLGIHEGTLANWVNKDIERRLPSNGGVSESERAELLRPCGHQSSQSLSNDLGRHCAKAGTVGQRHFGFSVWVGGSGSGWQRHPSQLPDIFTAAAFGRPQHNPRPSRHH
jgi:transposase